MQEGWDLLGCEGLPVPGLWVDVLLLHRGNFAKSPLEGNHVEVTGP